MPKPYLISYDIANPRRLRRLHRALKSLAFPLQYSVFLAELSDNGLRRVVQTIERTIDPRYDDVRLYPLPRNGWARALGRETLPAGIVLTTLPLPFRSAEHGLNEAEPEKPDHGGEQPASGGQAGPEAGQPPTGLTRRQRLAAREIMARQQTGTRRGLLLLR